MDISAITGNSSATNQSSSVLPGKTLSQQDFLKLLVAQMSSQDPMNPQSNTDFAAQMAQFSSLQTSQNTADAVSKMQADQQVADANNLLGRTVTVMDANGVFSAGTVSSVQIANGIPQLMVNGTGYSLSQVINIQPAPAPSTTPQISSLPATVAPTVSLL